MTVSSGTPSSPRPLWLADLRAAASTEQSWLWQGYLARGGVTLLTSQWKSGKTTLLSLLLARLKQGGSLGGQSVSAGKAFVLSEEEPGLWCQRSRTLDLDGHVCWQCRPFLGRPTGEQWLRLLDDVLALRKEIGLDLFVVDPLASFLPCDENNAATVLEALSPLRRLTAAGMSVGMLHHPRRQDGRSARGSGAILGFADVLIEMSWRKGADDGTRVRRLRAWSRYQGTPGDVLMELNADGTDYQVVVEGKEIEDAGVFALPEGLRLILETADYKRTRKQIIDDWLPDFLPAPDSGTLSRWLVQAVESGQVKRDGTGRRNDPFRYWLPTQEEKWRKENPFWYETRERLEADARAFREAHPELERQHEQEQQRESEVDEE
jgi:hypothetical protein